MRLAHENAWLRIDVDDAEHLVRVVRTAKRIELAEIETALGCMRVEPRGVARGDYVALFDLRAPAGRTDELDERVTPYFNEMGSFRRLAVPVRSVAGRLHVERRLRPLPALSLVTDSEEEAHRFLRA
jgi:hypothetical protein